jgi:hypothetical protein
MVFNTTDQPRASTSTHTKNDVPLGDFIASGFGIARETGTDCVTCDPSSGSPITALQTAASSTHISITGSPWASNTTHTLEPTTSMASNSSVDLDQCWNSWSSYWAELPNYGTDTQPDFGFCLYTPAPMTFSQTTAMTVSWSDVLPTTEMYTITKTIDAGGFAPSTQYSVSTYTISTTATGTTYTRTTTWEYTQDSSCYTTSTSDLSLPLLPKCTLPSTQLSQCQASWETWIDHQLTRSVVEGTETSYYQDSTAPSCTQATAGSALCTTLKDAYVSSSLDLQAFSRVLPSINSEAYVTMSGGYYYWNQTWNWPSTAYFAPGCTL